MVCSLRVFVLFALVVHWAVAAGNPSLRFRQGKDRENDVQLKEVTGPFEIEIVGRFDTLNSYRYRSQKLFDFGNGRGIDNIYLGQEDTSDSIEFVVYKDGVEHKLLAPSAIVEGEETKWHVGVDESGLMWLDKDGTRLAQKQGAVPSNVERASKLLGKSTLWSDSSLDGAVLSIRVNNADERRKDLDFVNMPGQVRDAFTVSLYGRFDRLERSWHGRRQNQKLFDFTTEDSSNSVSLGQFQSSRHVVMEIEEDGQIYRLFAYNSIDQGRMAFWQCGVDEDGTMWIMKDGVRIARGSSGIHPKKVFRRKNRIGKSHGADDPIDGVVLGLRVDLAMVS